MKFVSSLPSKCCFSCSNSKEEEGKKYYFDIAGVQRVGELQCLLDNRHSKEDKSPCGPCSPMKNKMTSLMGNIFPDYVQLNHIAYSPTWKGLPNHLFRPGGEMVGPSHPASAPL